MKSILNKLYTKLVNGEIIVFVRHYYPSAYVGHLCYTEREDTVISRTPVHNPILKWDGQPFMNYGKSFIGRLSYTDYCKMVDKDSIWVFHDFSTCSNRMFEEVSRNCK